MDENIRAEYETKSQTLRADLKKWETSWAKAHDGKKPSRDDIKQNPDIAQKYKSYNKVRDILSGKLPPPAQTSSPSRKRKSPSFSATSHTTAQTPSKRLRTTTQSAARTTHLSNTTPSLNRKLFLSPASVAAPTPTSIGPTPQRDGRVLGLFDLLSGSEDTPSRPRTVDLSTDTNAATAATTPRKAPSSETASTPAHRHGRRTPMSTSKRAMLDSFLLFTPLKNRDGNAGQPSFASRIGVVAGAEKENATPGSASKSLFATPAFLKRGHRLLDSVDENEEVEDVRPLRLPRKPLGRGLSAVVAGLRKLEEEKLDDEMDAMREAEMEMGGMPPPPALKKVGGEKQLGDGGEGGVEVEDSQVQSDKPLLLGGFDDEGLLDSDVEEQLDRGQPLRVYQKKGQKRTTKRSKLKPTIMKRPVEVAEEASDGEEEVVPETQIVGGEVDAGSGSEFGGEEDEEEEVVKKKTKKAVKKDKGKDKSGKEGEEKEGTVKKAVRKVKATANANFKRLKLRNYGAKGGPGCNSRFKRRR